jgi:hypothetical protein
MRIIHGICPLRCLYLTERGKYNPGFQVIKMKKQKLVFRYKAGKYHIPHGQGPSAVCICTSPGGSGSS